MTDQSTLELIPVGAIDHHPANPRQDIGDIGDLVASIQSVGVLQPVAVHKTGKRFVCLMGNRRLAAAKQAGLDVVPAMVWTGLSDQQQQVVMLVENLQRADLNPVDEAEGYQALASTGMEQGEIGSRVGRSQSYVSRRLRLLECDDETKAKVRAGKLSASGALRTLAPKKDRPKAEPTADRADISTPDDEPDRVPRVHFIWEPEKHYAVGALPLVEDVRRSLMDALMALGSGSLPSAAAHIDNAHRALFNLGGPTTPQGEPIEFVDAADPERGVLAFLKDEQDAVAEQNAAAVEDAEDAEFADALAEAEAALADEGLLVDDEQAEAEDAMATIHQLRETPAPVSQLGAAIADAVASGKGDRAPAVQVTIGVPDGTLNTRLVTCEKCGRLTRTPELDFARHKAVQHIEAKHGGVGDVVAVEATA